MYRLRIVEQNRFKVNAAKYAEDLKRFHQLQDEYLMLVDNNIRDFSDLLDYRSEQGKKMKGIDDRQHEIYRLSSSKKRAIKTDEQYRDYQLWHMDMQKELEVLKADWSGGYGDKGKSVYCVSRCVRDGRTG